MPKKLRAKIPPRKYAPLQQDGDHASSKKRVDVHEAITAKIVAAIEAGAGEFQMLWHRPGVAFTLPRNALTEKTYRGSNILSLWIDADEKKFERQTWATFKQWQELGAQVRKGERGSIIVKYGEWIPRPDAGEHPKGERSAAQEATKPDKGDDEDNGKRLFAKAAYVFNIDQVDAPPELRAKLLPSLAPRPDLTVRLEHVDRFIAATGAEFREGGQRAYYRHRDSKGDGDFIQMPPRNMFTGTATSTATESYESTRLHETAHWAHASHRLDFKHGERFGDHIYAFNELIAELSAAFLCAELEISNTPRADHAQYLASWVAVLKVDTKAIFSAASLATRTVDYLVGLQPKPDAALEEKSSADPVRPLPDEASSDRALPKGPR